MYKNLHYIKCTYIQWQRLNTPTEFGQHRLLEFKNHNLINLVSINWLLLNYLSIITFKNA
jgi:hypothetical protein